MLRFNTHRKGRYLRSKFVEGKFLLASEASDMQLETLDLLRDTIETSIGDVFVGDAWKVEVVSTTQLRISPGEAYFKGLPYSMRFGKDQLVSGTSLTPGIIPAGVVMTDDPDGLGKLITFNDGASTPTDNYRFVITAREELITNTEDAFLKNANLTENTAQKIRLQFKLDIVSVSDQTTTPIPYTNDTSDQNLVNEIVISPAAALNGELISSVAVPGAEEIDGRDIELTVRNNPALGGGNPIPNGSTDQQFFFNGTLIDSNGTKFHINAIFNDVVSTQVVIRIDQEVGQPNPEIINGKPYTLLKRDVFVTDDTNGNPLGKVFNPIADVDWNTTDGFVHESKITDLRSRVISDSDFQTLVNSKFDLQLTKGGEVSFVDTTLASATGSITVTDNSSIDPLSVITVDGIALTEGTDWNIGASANDTAASIESAITASVATVTAVDALNVVNITAATAGSAGNNITLELDSGAAPGIDISGGTLTGGADDSPSVLTWTQDFTVKNPYGPDMTIPANSVSIIDGASLFYDLDFDSGGDISRGNLTVTVTGAGSTVTLSSVDLSDVRIGNVLRLDLELVEITAIDNVNDTLTVSPAIVGTGSATIYKDVMTNATPVVTETAYAAAVRSGDEVYFKSGLTLSNGESGNNGSVPKQTLDYIGSPSETTDKPSYTSTEIVPQGTDLTDAISLLDSYVSNATSGSSVGDLQEDRSTFLRSDETVTWDGTDLTFTSDIVLHIVHTQIGAETEHTVTTANSPITLLDGQVAYVDIDRTTDEASLTLNIVNADSVPAISTSTKDIIVLFKRIDTPSDGDILHIPLHKQVVEPGQTIRLGATGAGLTGSSTFIDTDGNACEQLKPVTRTLELQSPDLNLWEVTVDNSGVLTTSDVGVTGTADNLKIERDDTAERGIEIDNTGALVVADPPDGSAVLVPHIRLESPNGRVWELKVDNTDSIYTSSSFSDSNEVAFKNDVGDKVWVAKEVEDGMIQYHFVFDATTLPASGDVPSFTNLAGLAFYDTGSGVRPIYFDTFDSTWKYVHDNSSV